MLVRRRRRFECDGCGRTHIETHPQVTGKFTAEYAGELARASGRLSVMAVSEASEVGWGTIQREGEARRRRALPCRPSGGKVPPAPWRTRTKPRSEAGQGAALLRSVIARRGGVGNGPSLGDTYIPVSSRP